MITINAGKLSGGLKVPDQRAQWCEEHIGKGCYYDVRAFWDPEVLWCIEVSVGNLYFTFRNEQDATLFKLRWL